MALRMEAKGYRWWEAKVELRVYLRAVRRHWRLLATASALATGLAALITLLTPPQYATTTTFFIGFPKTQVTDAYRASLFSQERAKSYSIMVSSDRLAAVISEQPGVGLSPDEVQRRITARPILGTTLLQATVTDGSKERSKRIAEILVAKVTELVRSMETPSDSDNSTVKVAVVAGPRLDPDPVSPRPARNLSLGALLGLLVGAGAAVLRVTTGNTLKNGKALPEPAAGPVPGAPPHPSVAVTAQPVTSDANEWQRAANTGDGEAATGTMSATPAR